MIYDPADVIGLSVPCRPINFATEQFIYNKRTSRPLRYAKSQKPHFENMRENCQKGLVASSETGI